MTRSALLLCSLLLVTPAFAGPTVWSKATMTEAPSYFPAGSTTMVVAAGAHARHAASTLVAALQASDRLELVTDASALGNLEGLDDPAIVRRAARHAVDRVAIVRVFPAGETLKAVVTVYGKQGHVASAFTLVPGKALLANPRPDKAEDGVRRDQLQEVSAELVDSEITFKTNPMLGYTAGGLVATEHVTFYKNGRMISDTAEFYDAIEQRDSARDYRTQRAEFDSKRRRGGVIAGIGYLGALSFGTWAIVEAASSRESASATLPLLLTVGSVVAVISGHRIAGSVTAPKELTTEEGIQLAKRYNKRRRHEASKLRFMPSASPSGGGLIVGGGF
jgi:hypothetical protein